MYYGVEEEGCSFRGLSHKGQELVLLGRAAITGQAAMTEADTTGCGRRRRFWPECREEAAWSAQDCMTLDGIPYIGRFLRRRRNGMWRRDSANGA